MATAATQVPSTSVQPSAHPLLSDGWLEFNRTRWNIRLLPVEFGTAPFPFLKAVFFLEKHGKIWRPPLVPYASVLFTPTPTQASFRLTRQWLEVAGSMAQELRTHGLTGPMFLPPEITDLRPWQWLGFSSGVKYTFYIDFPYRLSIADHNIRAKIKRASDAGFSCTRTQDMKSVHVCLSETAATQEFNFDLTVADLELADHLMGSECLRCYVCYAPDGEPASTRVVLFTPGNRTLVWLAGTNGHLQSGATELLMHFVIQDLENSGAPGLDFVGANLPGIAAAKAKWGGRLVPFYTVETFRIQELARLWYGSWRAGIVHLWDA
jgi:hypothetical protein